MRIVLGQPLLTIRKGQVMNEVLRRGRGKDYPAFGIAEDDGVARVGDIGPVAAQAFVVVEPRGGEGEPAAANSTTTKGKWYNFLS